MESGSGDIKVMTQKNQYKGNINLGIEEGYLFPGSIFKTIVEEAALENNKISLQQTFKDTGKYSHENRQGSYTAEQAYIMSSNEIFMKIGNITGYDNIYSTAKKQGLLDKVLNFNYEQKGSLHMDGNDNGDISLLSIGQKFRITPLEALSLPNTVINNGIYVKPHIIKNYVDENSNVIKNEDAVSYRAISENTANIIQQQMRKVTTSESGTGKLAAVKNVDLGGKTDTTTTGLSRRRITGRSRTVSSS
jgi:cell division protein FtsI/penicillin-binding protein 2